MTWTVIFLIGYLIPTIAMYFIVRWLYKGQNFEWRHVAVTFLPSVNLVALAGIVILLFADIAGDIPNRIFFKKTNKRRGQDSI